MKKIINPWRNHEGYNCFGCSPAVPEELEEDWSEDDEMFRFQKIM